MRPSKNAVKLTATSSGQIAGAKRHIGETLCIIAGRKNQWIGKNTSQEKLLMSVNKIKASLIFALH